MNITIKRSDLIHQLRDNIKRLTHALSEVEQQQEGYDAQYGETIDRALYIFELFAIDVEARKRFRTQLYNTLMPTDEFYIGPYTGKPTGHIVIESWLSSMAGFAELHYTGPQRPTKEPIQDKLSATRALLSSVEALPGTVYTIELNEDELELLK